jgi:type VI secretion system secreted protein Hcp
MSSNPLRRIAMKRSKIVSLAATVVCVLIPTLSPAASPRAFVKVVAKTQGEFKGEASRVAGKDYIAALRFTSGVVAPRDNATGMPTGRRQYLPVVITKQIDATSPQFLQALVNNEVLTTVTIEFLTSSVDGKELVYYSIVLKNATVSDIHQHMDQVYSTSAGGSTVPTDALEDVSFTFQTIEVTSNVGQTTAMDDWSPANK